MGRIFKDAHDQRNQNRVRRSRSSAMVERHTASIGSGRAAIGLTISAPPPKPITAAPVIMPALIGEPFRDGRNRADIAHAHAQPAKHSVSAVQ